MSNLVNINPLMTPPTQSVSSQGNFILPWSTAHAARGDQSPTKPSLNSSLSAWRRDPHYQRLSSSTRSPLDNGRRGSSIDAGRSVGSGSKDPMISRPNTPLQSCFNINDIRDDWRGERSSSPAPPPLPSSSSSSSSSSFLFSGTTNTIGVDEGPSSSTAIVRALALSSSLLDRRRRKSSVISVTSSADSSSARRDSMAAYEPPLIRPSFRSRQGSSNSARSSVSAGIAAILPSVGIRRPPSISSIKVGGGATSGQPATPSPSSATFAHIGSPQVTPPLDNGQDDATVAFLTACGQPTPAWVSSRSPSVVSNMSLREEDEEVLMEDAKALRAIAPSSSSSSSPLPRGSTGESRQSDDAAARRNATASEAEAERAAAAAAAAAGQAEAEAEMAKASLTSTMQMRPRNQDCISPTSSSSSSSSPSLSSRSPLPSPLSVQSSIGSPDTAPTSPESIAPPALSSPPRVAVVKKRRPRRPQSSSSATSNSSDDSLIISRPLPPPRRSLTVVNRPRSSSGATLRPPTPPTPLLAPLSAFIYTDDEQVATDGGPSASPGPPPAALESVMEMRRAGSADSTLEMTAPEAFQQKTSPPMPVSTSSQMSHAPSFTPAYGLATKNGTTPALSSSASTSSPPFRQRELNHKDSFGGHLSGFASSPLIPKITTLPPTSEDLLTAERPPNDGMADEPHHEPQRQATAGSSDRRTVKRIPSNLVLSSETEDGPGDSSFVGLTQANQSSVAVQHHAEGTSSTKSSREHLRAAPAPLSVAPLTTGSATTATATSPLSAQPPQSSFKSPIPSAASSSSSSSPASQPRRDEAPANSQNERQIPAAATQAKPPVVADTPERSRRTPTKSTTTTASSSTAVKAAHNTDVTAPKVMRVPGSSSKVHGSSSSTTHGSSNAHAKTSGSSSSSSARQVLPKLPSAAVTPAPPPSMYWSKTPVHGSIPKRCFRAHTASLCDDTMWLFGGCDSKVCFGSIWCFDVETMCWSKPRVSGDAPSARRAHSATMVDRRLFVFAGGDGPSYYQDLYVFDTVALRWSKPEVLGNALPTPRRAHSANYWNGHIVIFGGGNGVGALNDVWLLDVRDPNRLEWKELDCTGKVPIGRGYHTGNVVDDKLIVIGGSDGHMSFNDIHVLRLDTQTWYQVKTDEVHNRLGHTSTQVGSYLFVFGGHDSRSYSNEILTLNLVNLQWEPRRVCGQRPAGRGYHQAWLKDSRLFIHGGFDGREIFDDLYILDLAACSYLPQITQFSVVLEDDEEEDEAEDDEGEDADEYEYEEHEEFDDAGSGVEGYEDDLTSRTNGLRITTEPRRIAAGSRRY